MRLERGGGGRRPHREQGAQTKLCSLRCVSVLQTTVIWWEFQQMAVFSQAEAGHDRATMNEGKINNTPQVLCYILDSRQHCGEQRLLLHLCHVASPARPILDFGTQISGMLKLQANVDIHKTHDVVHVCRDFTTGGHHESISPPRVSLPYWQRF